MTRRLDLVETLHGHRVADPYRWLEEGEAPAVAEWTRAQQALAREALDSFPGRAELRARMEALLRIGSVTRPSVRRPPKGPLRYFHSRREGTQDQPVLYVRDGVGGADRALVDPNQLAADGSVALDFAVPSHDGSLLAYGTSESGSEDSTLRVRDVETGKDLRDVIPRTRYASIAWLPDGKRFYYTRFPTRGSVPREEEGYHRKVYLHVLGQDPSTDPLVFGRELPMTDFPSCALSPDGRWLILRVHQGWSKSELYVADTTRQPLRPARLTTGLEHVYDTVARDDALYVRTNEGASRYQVHRVDYTAPTRDRWATLVPEHATDVLGSIEVVGGQLLATYLSAGVSRLERFDARSGKSLGAVELPGVGTSDGFDGLPDGDEAFFDFESFAQPTVVRRLELRSGAQSTWSAVESPLAPDALEVTRGEARSRDGTAVPWQMVRRRDLRHARGDAPTLLYGYGGFNVNLEPRFSRTLVAALERGLVYVQANLRGGGELGEAWHQAGVREKKQAVFDDFIAVAEQLIATGVTRPARLAIHGRSNGGLLTSAALTQRPELFQAAVVGVPLTDMVRYHRFLIARLWIPEYGDPERAEDLAWLLAYSPYHRVREGTAYPATLVMTAEGDSRVDPMHARKLTAVLQHATSSDRPILLRTEEKAGHGAGKPTRKVADEYADIYGFVLWQLGVLPGPPPAP
ncbi:MAG: S9 family peptidase [Polyangiaceae bacterium]|nr:S9 family peptidase [Polyangiaceae bacterium]